VELLLLLWSRNELGLAYVNACTDDDEEDIVASQKQNPWQIVLSLSPTHNPRSSQVDPITISFPLPPPPPPHRISWWDKLNVMCPLAKP